MKNRIRTHKLFPVFLLVLILTLLVITGAYAANIDANDKWAWGTTIGWINFKPSHGGGATVYSDHLEGYVWGENTGWIRLGSYSGGGAHTYANNSSTSYGVNNDGNGNLSGYAWGANIGWINFNPMHGGVIIDPDTGVFDGYAWGENIGWMHFQGTTGDSTPYKVRTMWRSIYEIFISVALRN
jgi:hypothetical protein